MPNSRVSKLLEMLGSSFDGEVLNAARQLHRMATSSDQSISDMLAKELGVKRSPTIVRARQPEYVKRPVVLSTEETEVADASLRPMLNRLADLLEDDRLDQRDHRFAENILGGFRLDDQMPTHVRARVQKIVRMGT